VGIGDFFVATGQGVVVLNLKRVDLNCIQGIKFLPPREVIDAPSPEMFGDKQPDPAEDVPIYCRGVGLDDL